MRWAGTIKSATLTTLPRTRQVFFGINSHESHLLLQKQFSGQNRISGNRRGRLCPFFMLSHADADRGCPLWNWGDASILYASVSLSYSYLCCWICKVHPSAADDHFWINYFQKTPRKPKNKWYISYAHFIVQASSSLARLHKKKCSLKGVLLGPQNWINQGCISPRGAIPYSCWMLMFNQRNILHFWGDSPLQCAGRSMLLKCWK